MTVHTAKIVFDYLVVELLKARCFFQMNPLFFNYFGNLSYGIERLYIVLVVIGNEDVARVTAEKLFFECTKTFFAGNQSEYNAFKSSCACIVLLVRIWWRCDDKVDFSMM